MVLLAIGCNYKELYQFPHLAYALLWFSWGIKIKEKTKWTEMRPKPY
jgi:hypothetical protein